MASTNSALNAQRLKVGYGNAVVVDGATFDVPEGSICTLVGPNGAGKSTMLKTIARQLDPLGGTVIVRGRDLRTIGAAEFARTAAILTTERTQAELMTASDVVAMGRYPHTGRLGLLQADDHRAVAHALDLVGLSRLADKRFARLSDGQKQRVMIARALCQEPRILVLDEPTSFLDIRHKLAFVRLARRLAHEEGVTIVMTLHELELAQHASDLLVCVASGRIDRVGTPDEVFSGGYIRRLYGVDDDAFDEVYPGLDAGTATPSSSPLPAKDANVRSGRRQLRRGITTGTCAALATSGATRLLLSGEAPRRLGLVTPQGTPVEVCPAFARLADDGATCGVRKDAGDDPDVTDGVIVVATVRRRSDGLVTIDGGEGVGRVTRPGLDQPVGAAAINRVPRQMIAEQARLAAHEHAYEGGLDVTISIPEGEAIARRTFNPQLGVVGGLSVLGTSGIEEPMSEQALVQTIEVSLRQAREMGSERLILLPGNYAEEFVRERLCGLDDVPQIKYSNYLGEAIDAASGLGFSDVLVVGHMGKLVKVAGAIMNTHSHVADCRLEIVCAHAATCGASRDLCSAIMEAATTDAALDLLQEEGLVNKVMESLLCAMQRHLDTRAADGPRIGAVVFSNRHGTLGATSAAREILASWGVTLPRDTPRHTSKTTREGRQETT